MPFLDLARQTARDRAALDEAIDRVLTRGRFVLGSEGEAFEREFAAACGARFAVAVASGTDAITLALQAVGGYYVTHQLKNASGTYGAFGSVIGIVVFLLLLLAKLTMYAAELNPVLARSLYPRALPLGGEPTAADRQVLADLVHAEQRRDDQAIGVGFGDHASTQAASTPPGTPTSHSDMARSAFATGWSGTPPSHP